MAGSGRGLVPQSNPMQQRPPSSMQIACRLCNQVCMNPQALLSHFFCHIMEGNTPSRRQLETSVTIYRREVLTVANPFEQGPLLTPAPTIAQSNLLENYLPMQQLMSIRNPSLNAARQLAPPPNPSQTVLGRNPNFSATSQPLALPPNSTLQMPLRNPPLNATNQSLALRPKRPRAKPTRNANLNATTKRTILPPSPPHSVPVMNPNWSTTTKSSVSPPNQPSPMLARNPNLNTTTGVLPPPTQSLQILSSIENNAPRHQVTPSIIQVQEEPFGDMTMPLLEKLEIPLLMKGKEDDNSNSRKPNLTLNI